MYHTSLISYWQRRGAWTLKKANALVRPSLTCSLIQGQGAGSHG
ncbi:hypothetical protein clg_36 [Corynebacterium phage CL31]|nr:hypothetical protein clg_36 [Corynebacterium phage CL31]